MEKITITSYFLYREYPVALIHQPKNLMRKYLSALFALLLLTNVACNDSNSDNDSISESRFEDLFANLDASEYPPPADDDPYTSADTVIFVDTVKLSDEIDSTMSGMPLLPSKPDDIATKPVHRKDKDGCLVPNQIYELRGGGNYDEHKFKGDQNASAKLFGFKGNIGKKEILIIKEYIRTGSVYCKNGVKTYTIGLRCYVHVTEIKGKASFDKLSAIAANAELGNLSARYSLQAVGFPFDGRVLVSGLDTNGEYDVDNFGKINTVFASILNTLNDDNPMIIDPVLAVTP